LEVPFFVLGYQLSDINCVNLSCTFFMYDLPMLSCIWLER
jgi:hypothetical protein